MFSGNKIVLDEEVLAICEGKEKDKLDAKTKVIRNAIKYFKMQRAEYLKLLATNKDENKYTAKDKKVVIYFLKKKQTKQYRLYLKQLRQDTIDRKRGVFSA